MERENSPVKFAMNYGLYLGIAYIAVVMVFHIGGHLHFPGDQSGWINLTILVIFILRTGRKYSTEVLQDEFTYKMAFRYAFLLSFFSALIFAFFGYWYYAVIATDGISNFIDQMAFGLREMGTFTIEQQDVVIEMYRSTLNPGFMAFLIAFSQIFMGVIAAMATAFFVKTPKQINKL